jgi:hypothetical protein
VTITLVLQTIVDVVLMLLTPNQWVIGILYVVRFALVQQVGNSASKIIKLRAEGVLKSTSEEQLAIYNSINVTGDFVARALVVAGVYVVSVVLMKNNQITFMWVRNLFFILLCIGDALCILAMLSIRQTYFITAEPTLLDTEEGDADQRQSAAPELNNLLNDPGLKKRNPVIGWFIYMWRATKIFYNNKLLLCSTVHLWIVVLLTAMVVLVLRFNVAQTNVILPMTPENFCGGTLITLVEQQIYWEVSRMVGSVLYGIVISQVTPLYFYSNWSMFFGVVLGISTIITYMADTVGPTVGGLNLALINMVVYFFTMLDSNLSCAVVDPAMTGYLFGIQGAMNQTLPLIPTLLARFLPAEGITAVFGFFVVMLTAFGIYFARKYEKRLLLLEDDGPRETGFIAKHVFGYRPRKGDEDGNDSGVDSDAVGPPNSRTSLLPPIGKH